MNLCLVALSINGFISAMTSAVTRRASVSGSLLAASLLKVSNLKRRDRILMEMAGSPFVNVECHFEAVHGLFKLLLVLFKLVPLDEQLCQLDRLPKPCLCPHYFGVHVLGQFSEGFVGALCRVEAVINTSTTSKVESRRGVGLKVCSDVVEHGAIKLHLFQDLLDFGRNAFDAVPHLVGLDGTLKDSGGHLYKGDDAGGDIHVGYSASVGWLAEGWRMKEIGSHNLDEDGHGTSLREMEKEDQVLQVSPVEQRGWWPWARRPSTLPRCPGETHGCSSSKEMLQTMRCHDQQQENHSLGGTHLGVWRWTGTARRVNRET